MLQFILFRLVVKERKSSEVTWCILQEKNLRFSNKDNINIFFFPKMLTVIVAWQDRSGKTVEVAVFALPLPVSAPVLAKRGVYIYRQCPPLPRQCGLIGISSLLDCVLTGVTALCSLPRWLQSSPTADETESLSVSSSGDTSRKKQNPIHGRRPIKLPDVLVALSAGPWVSEVRLRLYNNIHWARSWLGRDTDVETINCEHTRQA